MRAPKAAMRRHRLSWAPSAIIDRVILPKNDPYTQCLTVGCPDDFYAVRVGLPNVSETPYRVHRIVGRASDTWSDYLNPTGKSAWTTLTFTHRGEDKDAIVSIGGASPPFDIAGRSDDVSAGETYIPHWTWTDWRPIRSLTRTDRQGGMRVLMLRMLLPQNQTITYASSGFHGYFGQAEVHHGFDHVTAKWHGDCVTEPVAIDSTHASIGQGVNSMACVQFLTKSPGVTGIVTGDSHYTGTSATAQLLSFALRASVSVGSSAVGRVPIGFVTCATGGARSGNFFPRLLDLLDAVRPGFVILPGWTYNDEDCGLAANESACTAFFARLLMAADQVKTRGAIPIFMTPFPRDENAMTAEVIAPWRRLRNDILMLRHSGEIVLDATSLLGARRNGMLTGTYRPEFTNDDIHPNDAGHAALAEVLKPILQAICSIY